MDRKLSELERRMFSPVRLPCSFLSHISITFVYIYLSMSLWRAMGDGLRADVTSLSCRAQHEKSALLYAVEKGHTECVRLLLHGKVTSDEAYEVRNKM